MIIQIKKNNIAYRIVRDVLYNIESKVTVIDEDRFLIDVEMYLPDLMMEKLEVFEREGYTFSISRNERKYITKIAIYK